MGDNAEPSGSRAGGDENPWLSMLATGGNLDMHDADDEMEELHHQEAADPSGGDEGNETNTSGAGDGTSGSEAKRRCKARRPNQLDTTRDVFIDVDPSGLPTHPDEYARSYGN